MTKPFYHGAEVSDHDYQGKTMQQVADSNKAATLAIMLLSFAVGSLFASGVIIMIYEAVKYLTKK